VGRFALNVDLAPTIAAAAGIRVAGVEGRSLLGLMSGAPARWRSTLEHFDRGPPAPPSYCGYRGSRWKYVQYATGEEELYDPRSDPHELSSQHRAAGVHHGVPPPCAALRLPPAQAQAVAPVYAEGHGRPGLHPRNMEARLGSARGGAGIGSTCAGVAAT
jgi:hypothetical protein